MRISDVVKAKGDNVVTLKPTETVATLLSVLAEHNIGAVVISEDGAGVQGIVSERDVVRHLGTKGTGVVDAPVADLMTGVVHTCGFDDDLESLAATMTNHRVRHVPVVHEGKLAAMVTIGDVVKHRLAQLEEERDHLTAYISQ